jgi:hypothetical protein
VARPELSHHTRDAILDLQIWIERSDPGATPRPVPMSEPSSPKPRLLVLCAFAGACAGWLTALAAWNSLS